MVLEVLGPGREILLSGYSKNSTNLKLRLPPDLSGLLVAVELQVQKGITARTGVINPNHEEVGLLLPNRGRKKYIEYS